MEPLAGHNKGCEPDAVGSGELSRIPEHSSYRFIKSTVRWCAPLALLPVSFYGVW